MTIFVIIYSFILKIEIASCDWTYWNPGKFLLSDPIPSEAEMPLIYHEYICNIASYLVCSEENTSEDPSPSSSPSPINMTESLILVDEVYTYNILHQLGELLLDCNKQDIPMTTLTFISENVPHGIWGSATSEDTPLIQYLDIISRYAPLDNRFDKTTFIAFRVGVCFYNQLMVTQTDYNDNRTFLDNYFYQEFVKGFATIFPDEL